MNGKRLILSVLVLLLVLAMLFGCGSSKDPAETAEPESTSETVAESAMPTKPSDSTTTQRKPAETKPAQTTGQTVTTEPATTEAGGDNPPAPPEPSKALTNGGVGGEADLLTVSYAELTFQ